MSTESTERRVTQLETFASDVREYTRILTETVRRMDERDDRHESWIDELHAAQADADARIAALADAQIRTEDAIVSLRTEISDLAGIVRQLANRQNGSGQ